MTRQCNCGSGVSGSPFLGGWRGHDENESRRRIIGIACVVCNFCMFLLYLFIFSRVVSQIFDRVLEDAENCQSGECTNPRILHVAGRSWKQKPSQWCSARILIRQAAQVWWLLVRDSQSNIRSSWMCFFFLFMIDFIDISQWIYGVPMNWECHIYIYIYLFLNYLFCSGARKCFSGREGPLTKSNQHWMRNFMINGACV